MASLAHSTGQKPVTAIVSEGLLFGMGGELGPQM